MKSRRPRPRAAERARDRSRVVGPKRQGKRILVGAGIALAAVVVSLALLGKFADRLLFWAARPASPFRADRLPPAPDYAQERFWAALPTKASEADATLPNAAPAADPAFDVFYIHGTTHFSSANWNSDMAPDRTAAEQVRSVLAWQASAFNGCCRVYAPHYRQANIAAFVDQGDDGPTAIEAAYVDVAAAFDYYLAHYNQGRPFLIAGHSQGSFHGERLLEEKVDGAPLFAWFVAAYLPGMPLPLDKFQRSFRQIKPCASAVDHGCIASWNVYREGGRPEEILRVMRTRYASGWESDAGKEVLCMNPLTWRNDGTPASAALNAGAIRLDYPGALKALLTGKPVGASFGVVPDAGRRVPAQCRQGFLFAPDQGRGFTVLFGGSYHNYDYSLFYANVRRNALDRTRAFGR